MGRNRLEAFSDGVLAIVITIMVLELKVPHGADWVALSELWPIFLSYVLSFVYVGIYWSNHHHLIHTVQKVDGTILWANLHLLFWLSLIPFSTGWMGENHFAKLPVGVYGLNMLAAGFAYLTLERVIVASHGPQSTLARAVGHDHKVWISLAAYSLAVLASHLSPWISCAAYAAVALMWLIPDRRISRILG